VVYGLPCIVLQEAEDSPTKPGISY